MEFSYIRRRHSEIPSSGISSAGTSAASRRRVHSLGGRGGSIGSGGGGGESVLLGSGGGESVLGSGGDESVLLGSSFPPQSTGADHRRTMWQYQTISIINNKLSNCSQCHCLRQYCRWNSIDRNKKILVVKSEHIGMITFDKIRRMHHATDISIFILLFHFAQWFCKITNRYNIIKIYLRF